MGFFDKLTKKPENNKKLDLDITPEPNVNMPNLNIPEPPKNVNLPSSDSEKIKFDLILSEINNVKMQMEMINERLKNIEKKIDEKGSIRYI